MLHTVVKSNGESVQFNPGKLNKMAEWGATVGICWSSLVFDALRKVEDGCKTSELQQALIDACAEKQTPEHLDMAARLYLGTLYKTVHGGFETRPDFSDFYYDMVGKGVWEEMSYDDTELFYLNDVIDNDKDLTYKLSTLKQISQKYSKQYAGKVCETPQYTFLGIAMKAMESQPEARRLKDVEKLYTYLSDLKINQPTPFLSGLRTPFKGFASCCVLKSEDTADSIENMVHAAYKFTNASAGIGGTMTTRSVKDPIRNAKGKHTGKIPYYRYLQGAVKSTKQEVRGGGATTHFTAIDPEIESLLRLKHPTTVEAKRIRGLDYSFGATLLLAEKAAVKDKWMLVSYYDNPELYESQFISYEKFKDEYEKHELSDKPKTFIEAFDLLKLYLTQRGDTGRIYHTWLDEMNTHTPFKDPIYSSNLCQEIFLPTKGFEKVTDLYDSSKGVEVGEIALCFLSCIVAGRVSEEEYEDVAYYALLAVDNVIDLMDYPFPQVENTAKGRRSVGIGITNLGHAMATNKLSYTSVEGKNYMHRLAEMHSYYLHKASLRLAKEKGVCSLIGRTKYPDGWLPVDTYNKNVDDIHTQELQFDWEKLRKEIVAFGGIRNSVLEATPPAESSSQASETTNSVYPIREYYTVKRSGSIVNVFAAPDVDKPEVKAYYELAYDLPTQDLIDCYAIFQKFHGQGISCDLYTDYSKYPNEKVPLSVLIRDYFYCTKMGLKSLYYQNSKGGLKKEGTSIVDDTIASTVEDSCESCKM